MVAGVNSQVFINEFHYDNTGTDAGEFVEIANPAGLDLTGWTLTLYNGNGGAAYGSIALSGTAAFPVTSFPSNGIQNGSADGLALSNGGGLVQFLSYEGAFTATDGPAMGQASTDIGVAQDGTGAVGQSLQLTGMNGSVYGDFTWAPAAAETPGAANNGQSFAAGPPPPAAFAINEFRISAGAGDATNNFVELFGTPGAAASGLTLLAISGEFAPGQVDFAFSLSAGTADAEGFLLVGNPMTAAATDPGDVLVSGLGFFGSPTTFLLVDGFTGTAGSDLDTNNDGLFDATPWASIVDGVTLIDGDATPDVNYSMTLVGPDGNFAPAAGARAADGTGAFVMGSFGDTSLDTPGFSNEPDLSAPPVIGPNLGDLRVATFNASLNRNSAGQLITDLSTPNNAQARQLAEIIQKTNADILLVNEFDYDAAGTAAQLFLDNYLNLAQGNASAIDYPFFYAVPSNTGLSTGFDLNNDSIIGGGDDAYGFGAFPGQFAFVIYSKHPILTDQIRTFQNFLWKDMPGGLLLNDNDGANSLNLFYSQAEIDILRLSSKNHVDVPVMIGSEVVHILAAHPTPPVFDGAEDRNGKRNFDEIRFWADYVDPAKSAYIYDDLGATGGLGATDRFVIVGDYNADPFDGDSRTVNGVPAANQLLLNPLIDGSPTDPAITPEGEGSTSNAGHLGNSAFDTAAFGTPPGHVRVDYALPSVHGFDFVDGDIFWPLGTHPDAPLATATDHRLVAVDLNLTDLALTPIYAIQGAAHSSPLVGGLVSTSGVVTAVDSNGYYLQDPTGDGDIATSDAIFVFTGSAPGVAVGDMVEVRGTVSEFFPGGAATGNLSTTQIDASARTVLSQGNALPAAVVLGVDRAPPTENIDDDLLASFDPVNDGIDFFESLEAMLVTVNQPLAVAGTNGFGELYTVVNAGEGATNLSSRGTLNVRGTGGVLAESDVGPGSDYNPERIQIDPDSTVTPGGVPDVVTGALLGDVTGVVGYNFGNFEVIPTQAITVVSDGALTPEVTTVSKSASRMSIASYNLLNLDPNDNDGNRDIANGQFAGIAADIVANLGAPDIIALQEVQDNSGETDDGTVSASLTLQTLVDAIIAAGGPAYAFIDNSFIGNNASGGAPGANIRTAFLYDPARVDLVAGSVQTIGAATHADPANPFFDTRLPMIATFAFAGEEFLVVNNHLSSKGGSTPLLGTVQPSLNGSAGQRLAQAQAVADFVTANAAAYAGAIVLGDLNEFEYEDSLVPLYAAGLLNLVNTLPEEERYSFVFDGNSQQLDHIFVTPNLAAASMFDIVHTNIEFAASQAASDHDPLIASFAVAGASPVAAPDVAATTAPAAVVIDVLANDTDPAMPPALTVAAVGPAASGTVATNQDGTLTYTPAAGFTGFDKFSYTIADAAGETDSAAVTVQVAAPGGQQVAGDAGDNTLPGDAGDDLVDGGDGSDFLGGLEGMDLILGGAGNDYLSGGAGNDLIRGGAGADVLYGGFGDNLFVFGEGDLSSDIDATDQIAGFRLFGMDMLDFSEIDAVVGGGDDAFSFIGNAAFSGQAGELRFQSGGGYTDLYGDVDGDGAADIALRLYGTIALNQTMVIA